MRRLAIVFFFIAPAALLARASVCATSAKSATPHWTLDHYTYDVSLKQEWEILVDCNHPSAPAKMKAVPHATTQLLDRDTAAPGEVPVVIHAGTAVEVSSPPDSSTNIHLSGIAMQSAFLGRPIRVRLNPSGCFITAFARGPHSVELAVTAEAHWSQP